MAGQNAKFVNTSKFLSLVLRHDPGKIGIALDSAGWVEVEDLLAALAKHRNPTSKTLLAEIVAQDSKKRFSLSEDGKKIRANQGHSVGVDLGYEAKVPPAALHHGTAERNIPSIRATGLQKRDRHHVHLSADVQTATIVGARHGKPVVLTIDVEAMIQAGFKFYLSTNDVWLTEHVPSHFIRFP